MRECDWKTLTSHINGLVAMAAVWETWSCWVLPPAASFCPGYEPRAGPAALALSASVRAVHPLMLDPLPLQSLSDYTQLDWAYYAASHQVRVAAAAAAAANHV